MSNNHPVVKSVIASRPNFLSTNAGSLYPKIDEFTLLVNHLCVEIAAVSETWLHHGNKNDALSIASYSLIRQDRSVGRCVVVCAFVSNSIPYNRWTDLQNPLNECLWLSLRPHRLPRNLEHCYGRIIQPPPPGYINARTRRNR